MFIVGLTGGMGAGKTTVIKHFTTWNIEYVDADQLAKEIISTDPVILKKIINYFGNAIRMPSGELDRKALQKIIFEEEFKKEWLECLLHPFVLKEINKKIKLFKSPYGVVVIPLLLEKGPFPFIDRILVIDASEDLRVQRILKRDQLQQDQVKRILSQQISREERLAQAQDVILNEGTEAGLISQVQKLHKKYVQLAKRERRK